ncbi:YolD-like family protein [Paenibacillus piri]|uniref:YolD-like family protein n=1 Tax=Paenibacillus piri TaxID=2547395 RepID=A0A4R5KR64_9BACL|nr:YolD-like family protein [Paenibacillus piri]TDF98279.1 hypothetical protein E1757_12365 [Paenibacillus piri]
MNRKALYKEPEKNSSRESPVMMRPERSDTTDPVKRQTNRMKPVLTEAQQQELFGKLKASRSKALPVTVTLFREHEDRQVAGIVTAFDPRYNLIKVEKGAAWEVFQFDDVIRVE